MFDITFILPGKDLKCDIFHAMYCRSFSVIGDFRLKGIFLAAKTDPVYPKFTVLLTVVFSQVLVLIQLDSMSIVVPTGFVTVFLNTELRHIYTILSSVLYKKVPESLADGQYDGADRKRADGGGDAVSAYTVDPVPDPLPVPEVEEGNHEAEDVGCQAEAEQFLAAAADRISRK